LRHGSSTAAALEAVREAQGDQQTALASLRAARAHGPVRAEGQLADALAAEGTYLATVERLLVHPRSVVVSRLPARAKAARKAFAALPDSGGVTDTIRGWRRLAAYARASHG
jgi:hypothetical protein